MLPQHAMRSIFRTLFPLLGIAAAGFAQTQWLVGPGGYAQIRDVMPLVAAGDAVVVAPGSYYPFTCTRGITIRAQTPGTVTIAFDWFALPSTCGCTCLSMNPAAVRFLLPAGATAHVVGLSFAPHWSSTPCLSYLHQMVSVSGGRVTFDQCSIDCLFASGTALHLQHCSITSQKAQPGLSASSSSVTIVGGTVAGANAGVVGASAPAWPAIVATNSRVHASGVAVQGGSPSAASPGARGIDTSGGSLWLVDSTVTAGAGCAVGATGVVRIDRSTLIGGGAGCAVSPTGPPLLGIDRGGPITIGQVFQLTLVSEPNALLLVYATTRLGAPIEAPVIDQPFWLDPATLFVADVATAGPTGQTTFGYPVPAVPALVGAEFWLQGVGGSSFPLQTSPVVGGIVR